MLVVGKNPNGKFQMNTEGSSRRWLLWAVLAVAIVGVLLVCAIPNYSGSHTSKFNGILNRLRQIEAAKEQWAIEHGLTNAPPTNRVITEKDLVPYLLPVYTERKEFGAPAFGELYLIRDMNQPAEAVLTQDLTESDGRSLPRGTIIRLDLAPESDGWEITSPDGTSTIYRWMHGNLTTLHR
jgi:hypothetical protein